MACLACSAATSESGDATQMYPHLNIGLIEHKRGHPSLSAPLPNYLILYAQPDGPSACHCTLVASGLIVDGVLISGLKSEC